MKSYFSDLGNRGFDEGLKNRRGSGLRVRFAEYAVITAFPRLRRGCVQDKERAGSGSRC